MLNRVMLPVIAVLCASQLLLLTSAQTAKAPAPSLPVPVPTGPSPSPSPPVPVPSAIPPPVNFVPFNVTSLSVANGTFTGRVSKVATTSPDGSYLLVMIMDGFGSATEYQYCWTEVHDAASGTNLTFREPCHPIKIQSCTLSLTSGGDLQLVLESSGAKLVAWNSETDNQGVVNVKLQNDGVLTLVKADDTIVWKSSDHLEKSKSCTQVYNPGNGSSMRYTFNRLFVCAVAMSLAVLLSF